MLDYKGKNDYTFKDDQGKGQFLVGSQIAEAISDFDSGIPGGALILGISILVSFILLGAIYHAKEEREFCLKLYQQQVTEETCSDYNFKPVNN